MVLHANPDHVQGTLHTVVQTHRLHASNDMASLRHGTWQVEAARVFIVNVITTVYYLLLLLSSSECHYHHTLVRICKGVMLHAGGCCKDIKLLLQKHT